MKQPAAYRRVQILPVWFEGAGNMDHTLTTNELEQLCRQAGGNLSIAVQQTLVSKGYRIVGRVSVLPDRSKLFLEDPKTLQQLEAVRVDLCENLLRQYPFLDDQPLTFRTNSSLGFSRYFVTSNTKRVMLEHNPFHYEMAPALTNLLSQLGATNSEAVLLVDTKAFFESKHNRVKRAMWNFTGGGVLAVTEVGVNVAVIVFSAGSVSPVPIWVDPFWHSSNSLQHIIALVDTRTREVLWLNRWSFSHKNPRDAEVLAETVDTTMNDLPAQNVR